MKVTQGFRLFFLTTVLCFVVILGEAPEGLGQDVYCAGCEATVKELQKMLNAPSPSSSDDIDTSLDSVCTFDKMMNYEYIPPKLVEGCEHLMENYKDGIKQVLTKHYQNPDKPRYKDLDVRICRKVTDACVGVAMSVKTAKAKDGKKVDAKKFKSADQLSDEQMAGIEKAMEEAAMENKLKNPTPVRAPLSEKNKDGKKKSDKKEKKKSDKKEKEKVVTDKKMKKKDEEKRGKKKDTDSSKSKSRRAKTEL